MRLKPRRTAAACLIALACAGPACQAGADTAQPERKRREGAPFWTQPPAGTLRASKIIGLGVIGMDHVPIGSIEDVLVDGQGHIRGVVIGVGGFLGVGEKYVAVPFDQFAWNVGDVPLTGGPSSVAVVGEGPTTQTAATVGPQTIPGADTDRAVFGAVQNGTSGRMTEATGSGGPTEQRNAPATVLAGERLIRVEVRLTKGQLTDAPAFRFERSER